MRGFLVTSMFLGLPFIGTIAETNKWSQIRQNWKNDFTNAGIIFSCSYSSSISPDDCIPDNLSSFNSESLNMAMVLKKITTIISSDSTAKVNCNFMPYECTFPEPVFKAITTGDSVRYILYTRKQLDQLVAANTDWVAYSIFAHEIGHHIYGHSLRAPKDLSESRQRELEADFFSGFVLQRLKSTLIQSQSGLNSITTHPSPELEEFCTHPTKDKRLAAVEKGYQFSVASSDNLKKVLNIDSLSKQKSLETIFSRTLELLYDKRYNEALDLLNSWDTKTNEKYRYIFLNNRGYINFKAGKVNEGLDDIKKAVQLNNSDMNIFRNLSEIKLSTKDKTLKAEAIEDLKQAQIIESTRTMGIIRK